MSDPVTSLFSASGYVRPVPWTPAAQALALTHYLTAIHSPDQTPVVKHPHLHEQWARDTVQAPRLVEWVTGLLGANVGVDQSFLVMKWPKTEFIVPEHQDGVTADVELDPQGSISCWLSISEAPIKAGALQVSPGSQNWGYLPHDFDATGALAAHSDPRLDSCEFVTLPTKAGDAVMFDVRLLHRSGPNVTRNPRIGLNIVYARPDAYRRGSASARDGWMPLELPQRK